jgi:hypothetical protein
MCSCWPNLTPNLLQLLCTVCPGSGHLFRCDIGSKLDGKDHGGALRWSRHWMGKSFSSPFPFSFYQDCGFAIKNGQFSERLSRLVLFLFPRTTTFIFDTAKQSLDQDATASKIETCPGPGNNSSIARRDRSSRHTRLLLAPSCTTITRLVVPTPAATRRKPLRC